MSMVIILIGLYIYLRYKHFSGSYLTCTYIVSKLLTFTDELLLVEIRPAIVQENFSDEALQGPNLEAIARATSDLPNRNVSKRMPSTECPAYVSISLVYLKKYIFTCTTYI